MSNDRSKMASISEEAEWLLSKQEQVRVHFLACLLHELTIAGRSSYSARSEELEDPKRLRNINEIQHRVAACQCQLLAGQCDPSFQHSIASWVLASCDPDLHELLTCSWQSAKRRVENGDHPPVKETGLRPSPLLRTLVRTRRAIPSTEAELITHEEEFHSSYRIYVQALQMLAETPENQCQLMGDYNVAWELKEDVAAGRYLVNRGYLSAAQEAWVVALAAALEAVDTLALPAGHRREANLLAMQNPNWEPLRYLAAEVARQLSPFTKLNSSYVKQGHSAA